MILKGGGGGGGGGGIPRFVLLQWGLQSNRIAAFKWVPYHPISG